MFTLPYGAKKTEYANPGAMNYAFVPNMTLPALGIVGAASLTKDQYTIFQGRQVMTRVTVATDGLGGLQTGQFISQPLMG